MIPLAFNLSRLPKMFHIYTIPNRLRALINSFDKNNENFFGTNILLLRRNIFLFIKLENQSESWGFIEFFEILRLTHRRRLY